MSKSANSGARGRFITFEGGEGAGKTTQIQHLKEYLEISGHDVVLTREPGGVPEAERIRTLLVDRDGGDWDPLSECLLFFTARRMHIENLIKPALAAGKTVLCDRFTDSTVAYQGYGHGFSLDKIYEVEQLAIGGFRPDLTFILDLDVRVGLARSRQRLEEAASAEDRFENLDLSFHENLRKGFLEIARGEPDRCHIIDAAQDIDKIATDIRDRMS